MNEVQHGAVVRVENDRAAVRILQGKLLEAERKLKRSESALQSAIRSDSASWTTLTSVKET